MLSLAVNYLHDYGLLVSSFPFQYSLLSECVCVQCPPRNLPSPVGYVGKTFDV